MPEAFKLIFFGGLRTKHVQWMRRYIVYLRIFFGAADSFTMDQYLLETDPDFYITERQLREKVIQASEKIASPAKQRGNS